VIESERYDAVVIGAGVAGLTAAAELSVRGVKTLVIECHAVPGGCASFYQRDGYRFDVGATLISGFAARGVHRILNARYGVCVSPIPVEPAMIVHLPDKNVVRFGDLRWTTERLGAFGPSAEPFFEAQERIANLAWDFSSRFPALPVDLPGARALASAIRPRHLALLPTIGATVASILPANASRSLRAFVDAQLLITAQTDAAHADLAYGATALDIAREGTFHVPGGVATISTGLARAVRRAGSSIVYLRRAVAIEAHRGRVFGVVLDDGREIAAPIVISAIPLHDTAALHPALATYYRPRLASQPQRWGAFMVYCGLPPGLVPDDFATHHQLLAAYDVPLGEGNTVFASFSPAGESGRARNGGRAVTLSTHTDVARWERAARDGSEPALRARYRNRLLEALERLIPGAASRADLVEAGTPRTFLRYTQRYRGLVGGLPQTPHSAVFGAFGHRTPIAGLYHCGDTAFPGQSTVGASLSAVNAARAALAGSKRSPGEPQRYPKNAP
jgi:C-3',4' desaturase CrtD